MADNVTANTSDGLGPTFGSDDIGGVHFPRVKLIHGADGTNDGDVSSANPLPVTDSTLAGAIKAEDAAHSSGDNGIMALAVRQDVAAALGANGDYVPIPVSGSGHLWTTGQVSHDSAITGHPFRVGGRAVSADYTAVGTGDQADLICDLLGKLVVMPYAINQNHWQYAGAAITDTADDVVKASAGAGIRNYVTSLTVINSHATVGTVVELKDGSTVIHRGYAAPLGGGYTVTFPTPLKGTAATALNVACVTTGSNTYVNASGYVAP